MINIEESIGVEKQVFCDIFFRSQCSYAGSLILAADIRMELAGLAEECKEQLRSTRSDETLMTDEEEDLSSFDLPDSVESACALGKLNIDDRVRVLEELKPREKQYQADCRSASAFAAESSETLLQYDSKWN